MEQTINIQELVQDQHNFNKGTAEGEKLMQKSLTELGAGRSILIDKDGNIIAGNKTQKAAIAAGIQKVRVIESDGSELIAVKRTDLSIDSKKGRELALADNVTTQVNLAWDAVELDTIAAQEGIDLPDWGLDPKDLGIAQEQEPQEAQEDDFDEEKDPVATICQEGDVWQLGEHRLMCGDSTDAENVRILLDGQKADLCFTDPPYGVSYTGGIQFKADGSVERNNREMIANDDIDIYAQVFEVLKDFVNGPCYVWFADSKAASLYAAAEKYGEIHALLIWVKNGGYGALDANYKQKHEPCLYWKPKGSTLNFIGATTETTIWEINKDGKNEYHPTQKPVALPAKAINNHKCDIVLDLFGGSGSTLIACEQLHRKARLMELDPHYCDVIIARWEKLTGQKAIKL
jgi:DNA modification methylase